MLFERTNLVSKYLTQLSDVEKGGATVFPSINVTLYPKKRAAAFWYNLSTSGDLGKQLKFLKIILFLKNHHCMQNI
jgi:hypothetical protein